MSQPFTSQQVSPDIAQFSLTEDLVDVVAWTEIDPGRYMPRRVRGSYQGRALG